MKFKLSFYSGLLLSFLATTTGFAQGPVRGIGNVVKVKINGQTVDIATNNAVARVTVYTANVIRVRIDKQQ